MANSKYFFLYFFMMDSLISPKLNAYSISPYVTMLWSRLEDLDSAECGLWCLSIDHIQYLSFCKSLTSIILRNRAPIVEWSILIILMMKNK